MVLNCNLLQLIGTNQDWSTMQIWASSQVQPGIQLILSPSFPACQMFRNFNILCECSSWELRRNLDQMLFMLEQASVHQLSPTRATVKPDSTPNSVYLMGINYAQSFFFRVVIIMSLKFLFWGFKQYAQVEMLGYERVRSFLTWFWTGNAEFYCLI